MKKAAVCLSGEMRGCRVCIAKLKSNIIAPFQEVGYEVDLFLHTRKDPWWAFANDLPFRCLWVEENRSRDSSMIVSRANPKEAGEDNTIPGRRAFLYQSYLQQYWSLAAVGEMKNRAEAQDGIEYNWVVRSRPDCYLVAPIPVAELVDGKINFPWNDWWPYEVDGRRWETVTDKIAIGPSKHMSVYFNKLKWLKEFCSKYRLQGEAFTAWQLEQEGIKYLRHDKLQVVQMESPYKNSLRPDA